MMINKSWLMNRKQIIKTVKKGETVKFKNYTRQKVSAFKIYAGFENILQSECNGRQNPDLYFRNKYQTYVEPSFSYKIVSVDDQFSKFLKSYLVKMMFMGLSLIRSKKTNVLVVWQKKYFDKELVMIKEVD